MADSYHHGNLRQALIDAGIKIINENGEENLSLRKVAAACDVSHAAPYAHFKDKEELIEAIKANVTDRFMEKLLKAIEGKPTADAAIIAMGRAYVTFFSKNPDYYIFLFGKQNITAHLKMNKGAIIRRSYCSGECIFSILKKTDWKRPLRSRKSSLSRSGPSYTVWLRSRA